MAKPDHRWTGSSGHLHMSLWDARGRRPADARRRTPSRPVRHVARSVSQFVAGMMALSRELAIFIAPNINSYKRYASLSWAPVNVVWGRDNRTTGFRLVGHGPALHVEDRFPGGDMNAYLTYAAMIGAGLYGIEHELELEPEFKGNGYVAKGHPRMPRALYEAIAELERERGRGRDLRPGRRRPLPQRRALRAAGLRLGRSTPGTASATSSGASQPRPDRTGVAAISRSRRATSGWLAASARSAAVLPVVGRRGGVRAGGQEQLDHLGIAVLGGLVERREPAGLPRVDVRAGRQQQPADLGQVAGGRAVERLDAHLVGGHGVDGGARVEQDPRRLRLGEERREMEGGVAVRRQRRRGAPGPPARRSRSRSR